MRHLVGADASYLELLSEGRVQPIDEDSMSLARAAAGDGGQRPVWADVLAAAGDPDAMVVRHRDDGSTSTAPLGIRLGQVVHHGTDHRSQICTALTSLGITPPEIDVWDFGWQEGRVAEEPAET